MMTMIQKPKIIDIKCGGHHSLFLSSLHFNNIKIFNK